MINIRRNKNNKLYCNNGVSNLLQNILIMDTAADQCTCGGPAWLILNETGENVKCNGYLKGKHIFDGPSLPLVSALTCVQLENQEPLLLLVNQACYYDDINQDESLCLPFQAEEHGVTFNLTPKDRTDTNGNLGQQKLTIEGKDIPLKFDGRKMYLDIRQPTEDEVDTLEVFELTSPEPFEPDGNAESRNNVNIRQRRKQCNKEITKYPGGYTLERWKKCLGLAPEDVIRKTFHATTQMQMNVEAENRTIGRRHFKSRFPALKEKRVNDLFYSDTFFPSEKGIDGSTCSQLFIGKDTDYMYVQPMRTESNSFQALQDFGRKVGLPKCIKTDNAKTEIGHNWTTWCRNHCIDTKFTEPHTPWQNKAERGIGDLATMVRRCMREFNVPLSRHNHCQKWCTDIRNHLASRKLDWRTPHEKLTGETPDISVFRFHFWELIEYYDPTVKQPHNGWTTGRFLGIAWDSGDHMTYKIEPSDTNPRNPQVLIRSTIRPYQAPQVTESHQDSGEMESLNRLDNLNPDETNGTLDIQLSREPEHDEETQSTQTEPSVLDESDTMELHEQLNNMAVAEEEDYEFHHIQSHMWEDGILMFTVELTSGKRFEIPFNMLKKDRPMETARYVKNHVIEATRNGYYGTWAKNILTQENRSIRRMQRYYNIDRIRRLNSECSKITQRRISRNKRNEKTKQRMKFGIAIPNSVKEALALDALNKNNLWAEAIKKEMSALDKAGVFEYKCPNLNVPRDFQYAPLRMIFEVKQEDLRRKARLVAGGHVVDSSMYESYSSVVQTMTLRLLQTIAVNEGLKIITGDIGNAFIHANTNEKIWTRAGPEFGEKRGSKIIFKKALYGLSTSARQWNLKLGDTISSMGFKPTRSDADLWIRSSDDNKSYEYIATHVDDVICVGSNPLKYISELKKQFPIRNIAENPEYYLGNDLKIQDNHTIKVSLKKYILEIINKHEKKFGNLRKEKVPHTHNDHPELDNSQFLDENGKTKFQSIMGVCQWICIAGRLDICFAVSSLSRFAAKPREGHLNRAIKILGYLKKYPSKGYTIDPKDPQIEAEYDSVIPDFGNQYADFVEEIDHKLPNPRMKELPITIFTDANHGHDQVTGKSITGILVLVGRTPIYWSSKRQASVQTATFGAEFIALKRAVEEAITVRYYLKSMGVLVSKPTIIYGDNMSSIKNTIEPGSPLKKKYLALSYHFCREHFSAGIVDIRKIGTKENRADPFTKGLVSSEFHTHFNEIMK